MCTGRKGLAMTTKQRSEMYKQLDRTVVDFLNDLSRDIVPVFNAHRNVIHLEWGGINFDLSLNTNGLTSIDVYMTHTGVYTVHAREGLYYSYEQKTENEEIKEIIDYIKKL